MTDQTPQCTAAGCTATAAITTPVPLCADDALEVAAATEQALEAEAKLSRVQALATIKANPYATDTDLAERTGWPAEWVKTHR